MARSYDEDEVAAILAVAAKKASRRADGAGVTLAELEAAAAEAGLDRALVRSAARDVDRVEEPPRGETRYGASARLVTRLRLDGPVDIDALASRLFAEMADRTGESGTQRDVGEARLWETAGFGKGIEAGQGSRQSLTIRPSADGVELVLREDVDRQAALGVGIRAGLSTLVGAVTTLLIGGMLGGIDDAIFLAVISSPLHAAWGWLLGRRWWRKKRRALAEAHARRGESLRATAATLALPGDVAEAESAGDD